MRSFAILLLIALPVLMAGCGSIPFPGAETERVQSLLQQTESAAQLVEWADQLHREGDLSNAMALLSAGAKKYPDDAQIGKRIEAYKVEWEQQNLVLEQQLLLIEVRRIVESIPLLEKLALGHPHDHLLKTRILLWQSYLDRKVPELIACDRAVDQINPWLARRCMRIAYRIQPNPETKQRIATLSTRISMVNESARRRQEQRIYRTRVGRAAQLLATAEEKHQQGELVEARVKVDEALQQDPQNLEAKTLQIDLQRRLQQQAEMLSVLGDRLYRAEQAGAAIAVWEAARRLYPQHPQLEDRIERARAVLDKLEGIRSENPPANEEN